MTAPLTPPDCDLPQPPYPADTRAKGWRFELDYEKIEQSSTWDLAAEVPMAQHCLLMMWYVAWRQEPCGTFPNDPDVIRAKCKISRDAWEPLKAVLMRGWWLASDGLLYHDTITARVLTMLDKRASDAQRAASRRARIADERGTPRGFTYESRVTHSGVPPEFDTKHHAPSTVVIPTSDEVGGHRPDASPLALVAAPAPKQPDCPHLAVLALWAEVLPSMPRHEPEQWRGARADHLRARWRETAASKRWPDQEAGLTYLRRLFAYVGQSRFLMGLVTPREPGRKPFQVTLAWLVKPENWAKTIEGEYHQEAA